MKFPSLAVVGAVLVALALAFGFALGAVEDSPISPVVIEHAQQTSPYGAKPNWLGLTDGDALFDAVRDRAYAFCFSNGKIDPRCALEQDEAVQFSVVALVIAHDQQRMPNKETLGRKEKWVATNPEIVPRVLNECWSLYKLHGAKDARILSVCLSNLTDASPLVPLPVTKTDTRG